MVKAQADGLNSMTIHQYVRKEYKSLEDVLASEQTHSTVNNVSGSAPDMEDMEEKEEKEDAFPRRKALINHEEVFLFIY